MSIAASYLQTSFLAGEWSLLHQGRIDHPKYKQAMAICYNSMPTEEGAWTRRPGTQFINWTKNGAIARLLPYQADENHSYQLEFTTGYVRFLNCSIVKGLEYVAQADTGSVTSISTASPAVALVSSAQTWATGDTAYFNFSEENANLGALDPWRHPEINKPLRSKQVKITKVDTTHFSLKDAVTAANIDGAAVAWDATKANASMLKVLECTGPWVAADLPNLRLIQNDVNGYIFSGSQPIQQLDLTPATSDYSTLTPIASASVTQLALRDGPYLDEGPAIGLSTLTMAFVGSSVNAVTLTPSFTAYSATFTYQTGDRVTSAGLHYISIQDSNINHTPASSATYWTAITAGAAWQTSSDPSTGLAATSVNRQIRFLSQPPAWDSATTYATGALVTWPATAKVFYRALAASTASTPGLDPALWSVVDPIDAVLWVWGVITAVNTTTQVATVTLMSTTASTNYTTIRDWRLGAFGGPNGYPTCGVFHEGRLWLAGAIDNRFDASVPGDYTYFAPTAGDGTVADANAVTGVFLAEGKCRVHWMNSQSLGIICGTGDGEFLITPNQSNDPITPTNVKASRVTKHKTAHIEPVATGLSLVFVQALRKKLQEFLPDVFSGKYSAPNLSLMAKHLTLPGITEVTYQEEPVPILWSLMADGTISGTSYRRTSSFTSEDPSLTAWHQHVLDGGNTVVSVSVGEAPNARIAITTANMTQPPAGSDGVSGTLNYVAYDTTASAYYVGTMNLAPAATPRLLECAHLDMVGYPWGAYANTVASVDGITVTGLLHLVGKTVSAFVAGLDCGEYTVASGGTIFIPYLSDGDALFTLAYATTKWTAEQALLPTISTWYKGRGSPFYGFVGTSAIAAADFSAITAGIPIVVGVKYASQGQMLPAVAPTEAGTQTGPALGNVRRTNKVTVKFGAAVNQGPKIGTAAIGVTPGVALTNPLPCILRTSDGVTEVARNVLFTGIFTTTIDDTYGPDSAVSWWIDRPYPLTVLAVQARLEVAEDG